MKKLSKIIACITSIFCLSTAIACGETPNDEFSVQFYYWDSGYGSEWITEIVDNFNEQQDIYTVYLETEEHMNTIVATLHGGEASNTYDLYMTGLSSWSGTAPDMEPLDDVLSTKYGNESKTIAQKFAPSQLNPRKDAQGSISSLFYGNSVTGLFYNEDVFNEYDYQIPRTSTELVDLIWTMQGNTDMSEDGISPLVHFADPNNGYWKFVYEVWAAQYWGKDFYEQKFLYLEDENGAKDSKNLYKGLNAVGTDVKTNDGRYKALEVLSEAINPSTLHSISTSAKYTEAQTAFIAKQSAMIVSGTWMKTEMSSSGANVRLMKTPVISSIVEKLENTSITDEQLSLIIKAVDENKSLEEARSTSGVTSLSENDYDRIKEARGMVYDNNANNHVFIPRYSNAKQGAKEFLKYFYSDEATLVWLNQMHESAPVSLDDPSKLNTSNYSAYDISVKDFTDAITYRLVNTLNKSKIFSMSGKDMYANVSIIDNLSIDYGRKSVDDIWDDMKNTIDQNWTLWIGA